MSRRFDECLMPIEMFFRGNKIRDYVYLRSADIREKYGLNITELKMIMYLANCRGHDTLIEIGTFLEANKGYMSQKINGLIERGFVTARPDNKDRRYVHYALTDTALPIAEAFLDILTDVKERVMQNVTPEEEETLLAIIDKIMSNADHLIEEE